MISSSEFIKGYTKIIMCSYLRNKPDYLYNIVKQIQVDGGGYIKISNPSALVVMKELENEHIVTSYLELSDQNQTRKYYKLTKDGERFYLDNIDDFIESLNLLKKMIGDKE